jgi:endonuclease-3
MTVAPIQREKLGKVHRRLLAAYGEQIAHSHRDPVDELVCTILSQNTNDVNRDVAFRRLRERFGSWNAVREAALEEIIEAIRPAGLAAQKAPAIKNALRTITEEQGDICLDFLEKMPLEEARAWLTQLKGVGPKTAAIVLLFAFGRPAFPVDTHIHRVSRRLGLIGPNVSREKAHTLLEKMAPPEVYRTLHLNLITHGRRTCRARRPRCEECFLRDLCDYAAATSTGQSDAPTHAGPVA